MYGKDEKLFLSLRAKFIAEMEDIDRQIDYLTDRRNELLGVLDGYMGPQEEANEFPPQLSEKQKIDDALVNYLQLYPVKRAEINDFFEGWNLSSDDIRRALERCKRRGLIKVKGRSKAAVWSAVK